MKTLESFARSDCVNRQPPDDWSSQQLSTIIIKRFATIPRQALDQGELLLGAL